jgi:Alpha/beta hydrolase domain
MTGFVRTAALVSTCLVASLVVAWAPGAAHAQAAVPTPTVEAAPPGAIFNAPPVDLAARGISEKEFFFSGTTAQGAYKSRMIVRRPINPKRFNGTVVVEWMNASSGNDLDVDFLSLLPLMVAEGYAYVAVTSQQVTVNFLRNYVPLQPRYASLFMDELQPAQPAAFEVFSQAGMALLNNGAGVDPLGGLEAKRLIAIGQSQSSSRLTTYINTIHDLTLEPVYDGIIPHAGGPAPTRFPLPIIKLNSENEAPGYFGQRGVSDPSYRYVEVPGTAHSPLDGNTYAIDLLRLVRGSFPTCPFPHEGPGGPVPIDPVLRASVTHLDRWIRTGHAPPVAPLIDMTPSPTNPNNGVIQRDPYGNALGGIRMPQQEAPTGRNTPSFGCAVPFPPFGTIVLATFPQWDAFDGGADPAVDPTDTVNATEPADAKAVYGNHARYVAQFAAATVEVANDGFILWWDALRMVLDAALSDVAK